MKFVIEIDATEYIRDNTIGDLIVKAAGQLAKVSEERLRKAIDVEVDRVVTEIVRTRAEPIVDEILTEGWQKADEWGQPRGQRVTVKQFITELLTKVDRYNSRTGGILPEVVAAEIRKGFEAEVEDGRKRLRDTIDKAIAGQVNEALRLALGVK